MEGRIVFENDASKNGVELFLQKSSSADIKKSSPNNSGNFIFSKISTGKYSLKIVKPFYKKIITENITIALGQSGSPLSEYGVDPYGLQASLFLSERGTAGETPALTNLDLRLKYDLGSLFNYRRKINILVDVFNVFDQKKGVRFDQEHYYSTDENGNPAVENPNYLNAVKYTPPRTIRIGIEAELF